MSINLAQFPSPGVYITQGNNTIPTTAITPTTTYMLGTGASGAENTIVDIPDLATFTTLFGVSPSTPYVEQFLTISPQGLKFINVTAAVSGEPTAAEVATALLAITENAPIGLIIAPEIFILSGRTDSPAVASEISQTCALRFCFGLMDPPLAVKSTLGSDDISGVRGYSNDVRAATGCLPDYLALFFPYLTIETVDYAPSAILAATAMVRWRTDLSSFPAGVTYPLTGTPTVALDQSDRDILSGLTINPLIIRNPFGTVLYGVRTLRSATSSQWLINNQVGINTLTTRLYQALEPLLFTPVTSVGFVYNAAKQRALPVLFDFWDIGALAGGYSEQSYSVTVDDSNNNPADVLAGSLIVDVEVVPTGAVEKVIIPLSISSSTLS